MPRRDQPEIPDPDPISAVADEAGGEALGGILSDNGRM